MRHRHRDPERDRHSSGMAAERGVETEIRAQREPRLLQRWEERSRLRARGLGCEISVRRHRRVFPCAAHLAEQCLRLAACVFPDRAGQRVERGGRALGTLPFVPDRLRSARLVQCLGDLFQQRSDRFAELTDRTHLLRVVAPLVSIAIGHESGEARTNALRFVEQCLERGDVTTARKRRGVAENLAHARDRLWMRRTRGALAEEIRVRAERAIRIAEDVPLRGVPPRRPEDDEKKRLLDSAGKHEQRLHRNDRSVVPGKRVGDHERDDGVQSHGGRSGTEAGEQAVEIAPERNRHDHRDRRVRGETADERRECHAECGAQHRGGARPVDALL